MRKPLFLLLLCTSLASAAEDPATLAARSQVKARKVIDSAVSGDRWARSAARHRNAEAAIARGNLDTLADADAAPSV